MGPDLRASPFHLERITSSKQLCADRGSSRRQATSFSATIINRQQHHQQAKRWRVEMREATRLISASRGVTQAERSRKNGNDMKPHEEQDDEGGQRKLRGQHKIPSPASLLASLFRLAPKTSTTLSARTTTTTTHTNSSKSYLALTIVFATIALFVIASQQQHAGALESSKEAQAADQSMRAALEAELDAILQHHDPTAQDTTNSKLASEAIISRLMLGNMSDIGGAELDGAPSGEQATGGNGGAEESPQVYNGRELGGPEAMLMHKILAFLQDQAAGSGLNGGQAFNQFPVLPASQAATIKRASQQVGNFLRSQQQKHPRQLSGYGRNFEFGLGKRPDSSVSGNILRLGDSASAGSHMAAVSGVSGLGKRPSAHRYDFGLGKRVASPAYPRYDFGLGKRAPSRLRYDFGLGK